MRVYVIEEGVIGMQGVVKIVSSKKLAIQACEDLLEDKPAEWKTQEKHKGIFEAENGKYTSYKMFFINGEKKK